MAIERLKKIDPSKVALVIIDMQNDFVIEGAPVECGEPGRATIPVIQKMKQWAYSKNVPVIYTQECHRADLSDFGMEAEHEPPHTLEGTPGIEIINELKPTKDDYLVRKRRYSAFFQTDFDMLLRGLGKQVLVFCGVCTNICVYGSALDGLQMGYHSVILSDAVAGTSVKFHDLFLEHMEFLVGDVIDSKSFIDLYKTL